PATCVSALLRTRRRGKTFPQRCVTYAVWNNSNFTSSQSNRGKRSYENKPLDMGNLDTGSAVLPRTLHRASICQCMVWQFSTVDRSGRARDYYQCIDHPYVYRRIAE